MDYSDLKELTQEYSILAQNFKKRQNPINTEQSFLLNSSLLSEVNHLSPISENKSEQSDQSNDAKLLGDEEEGVTKQEEREEMKEADEVDGRMKKEHEEEKDSEWEEGWAEGVMKGEEGISEIEGKEGHRDSEEGEEMLIEWEKGLLEWEEEEAEKKEKREGGGGGDVAFLEETYNIDYSNFSEEIFVKEKISIKRRCYVWARLVMEYLKSRNFTMFVTFFIAMFNFIYLPLNMIFDYFSYPTTIMIMEMIMIGYLLFLFVRKVSKYYKALLLLNEKRKRNNFGEREEGGRKEMENVLILQMRSKSRIIRNFIYDFLYIIPFALIFTKAGMAREVYAVNFIRLINVKPLMKGIKY